MKLLCCFSHEHTTVKEDSKMSHPAMGERGERGDRDPYTFKNQDWLPDVPTQILTNFLKGWDDSTAEKYLDYVQDDIVFVFGGEQKGKDAVKKARDSMIHQEKGPILRSKHFFETGFVTGGGMGIDGKWEICGVADVRYDLVDKSEVWTRAASWCRVVKNDGGDWLIERYEVFMDGTALFDKLAKLKK